MDFRETAGSCEIIEVVLISAGRIMRNENVPVGQD
jgi:hypothetical protein